MGVQVSQVRHLHHILRMEVVAEVEEYWVRSYQALGAEGVEVE